MRFFGGFSFPGLGGWGGGEVVGFGGAPGRRGRKEGGGGIRNDVGIADGAGVIGGGEFAGNVRPELVK